MCGDDVEDAVSRPFEYNNGMLRYNLNLLKFRNLEITIYSVQILIYI